MGAIPCSIRTTGRSWREAAAVGSVPSPERFQAAARGPTALLPGWVGPPWGRGLEQGRRCAHLGRLRSPRADARRQPSQPRRSLCLPGPGEWLGGLQISGAQDALAKLGAGQSIWGQGRTKQPLCPGREALLLPPGGALCSWRPWGPDVTSAAEASLSLAGAGLLCRGASPGAGQGALQASASPAPK